MFPLLKLCQKTSKNFSNLRNCKVVFSLIKGSSCILVRHGKADFSDGLHSGRLGGISLIRDYNFEYFRSNEAYKTTAVRLGEGPSNCVVSGPEFERFFDGEIKTDSLLRYLGMRENVMKLSPSQVKDLMHLLVNFGDECENFPIALKWLDEKCAISATKWPLDLTLYILDAWYLILGPRAFKGYYFSAVISLLNRKVTRFTKNHVIQILYFIGLSKISPPFLMACLESKLEMFRSEISDVEWAIACVSFFKTSTKIKSEVMHLKSCEVAKNLIDADERFHLTSILKSLRQARYYDEELLHLLGKYVTNYYTAFNFVECSNFLAAFSAHNVYHSDVFKCIEKQSVSLLLQDEKLLSDVPEIAPETHPALHFRVKDLARLLWAMVTVGHCPDTAALDAILNCVRQRLDVGEYRKHPRVLLDTLHSLALINCYPQDLLIKVLNSKFLEHLWNLGLHKPNYQFYFLYKSAGVESPESIIDKTLDRKVSRLLSPIPKSINKEKNERAGFKELMGVLEAHSNGFANFECSFVIPHIVIAGFLVKNCKSSETDANSQIRESKRTVLEDAEKAGPSKISTESVDSIQNDEIRHLCIEILDETVCVKNTTLPLGLMKTKVRQLKKLSYDVVELTPNEIREVANLHASEITEKIRLWLS